MTPTCAYCGNAAVFRASSGHIYSRDYGPIWECSPCAAWVGCHPDGRPLGRLADAALRKMKMAAHASFDPLITKKMLRDGCSKQKARSAGYKWLAAQLDIARKDCHIGMFDLDTCIRVVDICAPFSGGK